MFDFDVSLFYIFVLLPRCVMSNICIFQYSEAEVE